MGHRLISTLPSTRSFDQSPHRVIRRMRTELVDQLSGEHMIGRRSARRYAAALFPNCETFPPPWLLAYQEGVAYSSRLTEGIVLYILSRLLTAQAAWQTVGGEPVTSLNQEEEVMTVLASATAPQPGSAAAAPDAPSADELARRFSDRV